ncbi:cation-translocating P-type ATPase C-terminal domain-containing protein [Micromonospora sp. NBC_00898]|uniref:cation transporting ATPase C-terminal domain-containing protein n=1 Tax=Micromonospora sp. NBC_00898 TaxID=2975981 RepID=UPI0038647ED7|nr:cation-translocating P-type ATPase C-terminal domain-containing protein [Micromonospora sp. NBC_00898]
MTNRPSATPPARHTQALGAPAEVLASLGAFTVVLLAGGWRWAASPDAGLLAAASGAAFTAIVLGQLANAFACRSAVGPAWRIDPRRNPLLLGAVAVELVLLGVFLTVSTAARAPRWRPTDRVGLAAGCHDRASRAAVRRGRKAGAAGRRPAIVRPVGTRQRRSARARQGPRSPRRPIGRHPAG